jgi:hypothetical protein
MAVRARSEGHDLAVVWQMWDGSGFNHQDGWTERVQPGRDHVIEGDGGRDDGNDLVHGRRVR